MTLSYVWYAFFAKKLFTNDKYLFWYQNATLLAAAQNCMVEVAHLCVGAGHDSFIRVTRLFWKELIYVWIKHPFVFVLKRGAKCYGRGRSYMWRCMTWNIHMCNMTFFFEKSLFTYEYNVNLYIEMRPHQVRRRIVWKRSLMCVLMCVCDMCDMCGVTHPCVWHDFFEKSLFTCWKISF